MIVLLKNSIIVGIAVLLIVSTLGGCQKALTQKQAVIETTSVLPATTPWDLKELSKTPEYKWLDQNGPIRSLKYKGPDYKGKPTSVFAYYATPDTLAGKKSDTKFPGIVLVHGGGGRAFENWVKMWAEYGYAAIAMDLKGCGGNNKKLPDGGPDMDGTTQFLDIAKFSTKDLWPYHAISNVITAHSLILSFPEVDKYRTAITGISWGGYTTCIVAGLDNRFKAAVPVYGCGFLHHNSLWNDGVFPKMKPEDVKKWVQLYDPSMYIGSATMPIFFVNGAKDRFYPLDSYEKTYKLVKTPKNYLIDINMKHGYKPPWDSKEIKLFVDQYLKGTTPLPKIIAPKIINDKVEADVETQTKLVSARLDYTVDDKPNKERTWQSIPAEIKDSKIVAPLPPKNTKIWLLIVKDERNAMVSSEIVFCQN